MVNSKQVFGISAVVCLALMLFMPSDTSYWQLFLILAGIFGIAWFIKKDE